MARQTSAVELSNFVAGLITEASPLTFPPNATLDEQNFVLKRDGSRQRRLGMDYEDGFQIINTGIPLPTTGDLAIQSFRWKNAGGDSTKELAVVQVGNTIHIFDSGTSPISSARLYNRTFVGVSPTQRFSFTVVDGLLVIATNSPEISLLEYEDGAITLSTQRLLIRDMFGVSDVVAGVDLRQGLGVTTRPTVETNEHIYNLRNQTWAEPRKIVDSEVITDLISLWGSSFPSNSDVTTYSVYPDANDHRDRLTDRFNIKDVRDNPIGSTPAPKGYFIIDALARGASRLAEEAKLRSRYSQLVYEVSDLPVDLTLGGATILTEYAGRVFYAGFSGEVFDGDEHSPKMSSYILFSKLVESPTDINVCYQQGDPTSKQEPDLVDTDGGFIRIDGAYGIKGLVNVGSALMVFASNGVWIIQGGSDYGFKATNYIVTKVTSYGCTAASSIVQVDTSVMYWAEDGIYVVAQNQFGDYVADSLTQKTIQRLYEGIESLDRDSASAVYDSYERKVYWVYGNRPNSTSGAKQLVFDTTLGAFYPFVLSGSKYPMIASAVNVPPYRIVEVADNVTVNGADVVVDTDIVVVTSDVMQSALNETAYVCITGTSPTVSFTFSFYRDFTFTDWVSTNGIGFDARAYMLTGWEGGGDFQRYKQVPSFTMHFIKTENGFEDDGTGDWRPTNQSSCLASAQWEWSNNANSNRWGRKFQAYRLNRHYFPSSIDDGFDNGFYTVVTKNKLRGKGRVLSLLLETEPKKDCRILGWSMVISANGNV